MFRDDELACNHTDLMLGAPSYLLPCLALLLQGCGQSPTDNWLVGGWTPVEQSCSSGAGYIFKRTGEWLTEGEEGTWKLDGKNLKVSVTGVYDDSYELQPSTVVYSFHITEFDKNSFHTSASGPAPAIRWKRCAFDMDETHSAREGQDAIPASAATTAMSNPAVSCDGDTEKNIVYDIVRSHPDNKLIEELNRRNPLPAFSLGAAQLQDVLGEGPKSREDTILPQEYATAIESAGYSVSDIRVQDRDESLGTETCAANLTMDAHRFGKVTIPITMKAERTTDGKPYVTVSGLQ